MNDFCGFVPSDVTSGCYIHGVELLMSAAIAWPRDAIGVLLCGAGYTPDPDHRFIADVTDERVGGGYGRKSLYGRSVIIEDDPEGKVIVLIASNPVWWNTQTGLSLRAVVFHDTGDDATSSLIAWLRVDIEEKDENPGLGTLTLAWDADGVVRVIVPGELELVS